MLLLTVSRRNRTWTKRQVSTTTSADSSYTLQEQSEINSSLALAETLFLVPTARNPDLPDPGMLA